MSIAFGNYVIKPIIEIGRGTFGTVEKVEIYNLNGGKCGDYARKIFSPPDGIDIEEFYKRFCREVISQSKCVHKNITYMFLHCLKTQKPWFIMELAESDLASELKSGGLSLEERVDIFIMIMDGVAALHENGKIHRDIKPQNVLKFENNVYKITDFGLVKNANSDDDSEVLTEIGAWMGSRKYMSREAFLGDCTFLSDIFSLGIILDDMDIINNYPDLKGVYNKSTSNSPHNRYQSVPKMKEDFLSATGRKK